MRLGAGPHFSPALSFLFASAGKGAKAVAIPTRTFAQRPERPAGVKLTQREESRLAREHALWLKWCEGAVAGRGCLEHFVSRAADTSPRFWPLAQVAHDHVAAGL